MDILKIDNCYSWLVSCNDEVKTKLWRALRFRDQEAFHSTMYKSRKWDGYVDFFKKESGRFLTGLLPEVTFGLKHLGVDFVIQDNRSQFDFGFSEINEEWLDCWPHPGTESVVLRDYQVDYINQIIRNKRGIIHSPTASGKTNCLIGTLRALPPDTPTLVLCNKSQLVEQNYDEIMKWNFNNVGRFHSKVKKRERELSNSILCSTVQSSHLLEKLFPKIKVLLVDEIHDLMAKEAMSVYTKLTNCNVRIGFSATPFRDGGSDKVHKYKVKGHIGPVFYAKSADGGHITTKQLQERKFLSSAECVFYPVTEPKLPYAIYQDAVTYGIAKNEHLHNLIVKLVNTLHGRTLILVERLEHGDRLHELIDGSLWVRGEDAIETRKQIINLLKEDKDDVVAIASSGIFSTGINVYVNNFINAAGGSAEHVVIQRFGRGLRVAEDKKHLKYFDFMFTNNDYLHKHSWQRIKVLKKEGHQVTVKQEVDL